MPNLNPGLLTTVVKELRCHCARHHFSTSPPFRTSEATKSLQERGIFSAVTIFGREVKRSERRSLLGTGKKSKRSEAKQSRSDQRIHGNELDPEYFCLSSCLERSIRSLGSELIEVLSCEASVGDRSHSTSAGHFEAKIAQGRPLFIRSWYRMEFFITTLYYALAGLVGTFAIPIWYNKGPAANKLHILLVITAVICCYLIWAIVYLAQWHPLVVPILKGEGE